MSSKGKPEFRFGLALRSREVRFLLPEKSGSPPEKLLPCRSNIFSSGLLPRDLGRLPEKLFLLAFKKWRVGGRTSGKFPEKVLPSSLLGGE